MSFYHLSHLCSFKYADSICTFNMQIKNAGFKYADIKYSDFKCMHMVRKFQNANFKNAVF